MSRYGLIRQRPDPRDWRARAQAPYTGPFVDLTAGFPDQAYDQGPLGSCVSNGVGACLDFARVKAGLAKVMPARLFVYYNGRALGGYPIGQDTGLQIRDGLASVAKFGAPPEPEWPYDVARFTAKPSAQAYTDGAHNEALVYGAVAQGDIDAMVAKGYPLSFGFDVYDSFESTTTAQTGVMSVPGPGEQHLGGHCVVVVSTAKDGAEIGGVAGHRYRKCRNSWGTGWGLGGYFWMPVEVMDGPMASDFWQITTAGDPDAPVPPDPNVKADAADKLFAATLTPWVLRRHTDIAGNRTTQAEARKWLKAKGL